MGFLPTSKGDGRLTLGLSIGGAILLAAGILLSLTSPRHPEMRSLIDACMKPAGVALPVETESADPSQASTDAAAADIADPCQRAAFLFERTQHTRSAFSSRELLASFFATLGISILVAIGVSKTIEQSNRRRFEESLDSKTRELSEAVMRGMFNRRHPERLIDLVSENILQRELIRDRLSLHYVLKRWTPSAGADVTRLGTRRFVEVKATVSATMTNVSGSDTLSGKTTKVPICIVLPNPMYDELKSSVQVHVVEIDGRSVSVADIKTANTALQEDLETDAQVVSAPFAEQELRPGQSLRLRMVYTMVKELEDSELFQTLQISKDLSITLTDATGWNLRVRAKSIGFGKLDKVSSDDATHHWTINDILLPHQGVLIWWKERLDASLLPDQTATASDTHQGNELEA